MDTKVLAKFEVRVEDVGMGTDEPVKMISFYAPDEGRSKNPCVLIEFSRGKNGKM